MSSIPNQVEPVKRRPVGKSGRALDSIPRSPCKSSCRLYISARGILAMAKKAYISRHVVFDDASSWWSTEWESGTTRYRILRQNEASVVPEEILLASDSRPVESPRSSSRTDSSLSPWKTGVRESVSPRLATPEVSSLRDRLFDICLFLSPVYLSFH